MADAFDGPRLVWERERRFGGVPFDEIKATTTPSLIKGMLPSRGVG